MECVIAYQRSISTQVLFYVLTPIGHKRAPMQDDVYFMLRRKKGFFFFHVFRLDLQKFPKFSQCTLFLLVLMGNSRNPQDPLCGRSFVVVSRAGASACLKTAAAAAAAAENFGRTFSVSQLSACDVRGPAGSDSVAAAGPHNHVAVLFEDDVGAVVKVED